MNQLGHFEQNLLTELRDVVAEQAAAPEPRRALPRGRIAVGVVAVGVLAAGFLVGIPAMNGERLPAAHAVTTNNGTIDITINRLEDPEGLERELATQNVVAVVDFLPPGKMCAVVPDRYDWTSDVLVTPVVHVAHIEDTVTLRLVDVEGKTLHMWGAAGRTTVDGKSSYLLMYSIVNASVKSCVVVDAPTE